MVSQWWHDSKYHKSNVESVIDSVTIHFYPKMGFANVFSWIYCCLLYDHLQRALELIWFVVESYAGPPPIPDHLEGPPAPMHYGRPSDPPPGPCAGWSRPPRISNYSPSRHSMEPPVSHAAGGMLHVALICFIMQSILMNFYFWRIWFSCMELLLW